jgi:hypothetical protein
LRNFEQQVALPCCPKHRSFFDLQMTLDARQLGIPASAIPPLPQQPTQADLLDTRERLQGVVASFLSAGL